MGVFVLGEDIASTTAIVKRHSSRLPRMNQANSPIAQIDVGIPIGII